MKGGITYIGETTFKGHKTSFGIKDEDRPEHLGVMGSGSFGTSLLALIALQDIAREQGVLILDATGNLAQAISERIDENVAKRLIYLDPYDSEHPFSWNAIEEFRTLPSGEGIMLLSQALAALYRIPETALTKMVAEVMLARPDATVLLLYELVTEPETRARVFGDAQMAFVERMEQEPETIAAIQEHGRYLAKDLLIRNLLGQEKSKFTLASLTHGGVIIVDVSKIRMFPTRATPLVRLFAHAARVHAHVQNGTPVSVFCNDVVKYFEPSDLERLFAERKLLFSFSDTVHGEEDQLLRDQALLRAGSVAAFTLSPLDVSASERVFYPYIAPEELSALPDGAFAVALTIDAVRTKPFLANILPLPPHLGISPHDLVIASRGRFSLSRMAVEELFRKKTKAVPEKGKDKNDDPGSFSDAFRSIFAKSAQPPAPKAPPAPTPPSKPAERTLPAAAKELTEDELRQMLYVEPLAAS